jgi:DNA topoisomerase-1
MNVLIVESAAKARTLEKYLEGDWAVVATGGHVQTLPNDREVSGKDAKKAFWANRPGELPSPPWVWTDRGEKAVDAILEAGGEEPVFWIATDPDREGEFIAWCLDRILGEHGPTRRVTFQEVTQEAVTEAIEHPRGVNGPMVDSALVRKFLDRLVGFRTSKTASSIVGRGASMGRVQTPTLGFVVEKELEREAFVPTPYFEVRARAAGQELRVRFHETGDPDRWEDAQGRSSAYRTFDGELAQASVDALEAAGQVTLTDVREGRPSPRNPKAPFTTDALLQEAGAKLGWSPGKTSALASMLYEAGHITYIRTDSTRLAESAVKAARSAITREHGEEVLGSSTGTNTAGGPVQDAHEAIRPTRLEVDDVGMDDDDARKLYRLVRARTLASQMKPSRRASRTIDAACDGLDRTLRTTLSWQTFAGWEAVYREFMETPPTAPPDVPMEPGATWVLDPGDVEDPNPRLIEDETQPPGRFRPHTLIREMKEAGIGRPSTYARTVDKLEERGYLEQDGGALVPTERGRSVWLEAAPLYSREAEDGEEGPSDAAELFDAEFTALMEDGLDDVARGATPAPAQWEAWRDLVRDLHEAARERKKSGASTPRQRQLLRRLLENAPGSPAGAVEIPEELADLTYREAQELTSQLREAGVEPAPSEKQIVLIERLLEDLELDDEERDEVVGSTGVGGIRTTGRASEVIDELQRITDERRPPSAKQRRFIEGLMEETETSEAEAAALVEVESLDDLTGGREGTASALIDRLTERKKELAGSEA